MKSKGFWDWIFNPGGESDYYKKAIDKANGGKETPATVVGKSYAQQIGDFFSNSDNLVLIVVGLIVLLIIRD